MHIHDPAFSTWDRIEWSDVKHGNHRSVQDAICLASKEVRDDFFGGLNRIRSRCSRHQEVRVSWWYFPFIYIEVRDARWKHYPCYSRMLVSFDLRNGKYASLTSANQYAFARRGWGAFLGMLVGRSVGRYSDCSTPDKLDAC